MPSDRKIVVKEIVWAIFPLVLVGLLPFVMVRMVISNGASEQMVWRVWICAQVTAAFVWGAWRPPMAMIGAILIVIAQPVLVHLYAWSFSDAPHPDQRMRSTGGAAGLFIISAISLLWSPMPIAAAWMGRLVGIHVLRRPPSTN